MRARNLARWSTPRSAQESFGLNKKRLSAAAMRSWQVDQPKLRDGPVTTSSPLCIAPNLASTATHRKSSMRSQRSAQSAQPNKPCSWPTAHHMDSARAFGPAILNKAWHSPSSSAMALAKSTVITRLPTDYPMVAKEFQAALAAA